MSSENIKSFINKTWKEYNNEIKKYGIDLILKQRFMFDKIIISINCFNIIS